MGLREIESALPPGFRFYPSDEELVCYYLRKKVTNERITSGTMVEVDLHAREPWELPEVAKLTAEEWYFFSFRDRKYATGSRTNRATKTGYWKATGKDRMVHESTTHAMVGMRKTLVFYRGRAPNGQKTAWVMHEFRLETPNSPPKEDWVLCRVFHKRKAEAEQPNHMHQHNSNGLSSTTTHPGSSPDPSVVDKFDHQTGTALLHEDISSNCHSSNALLNLAMLRYNFLDRFSHDECDLPIPSSYIHLWAKTLCADHEDSYAVEKEERQTGTPHDMVGMVGASTNNNNSNTMELEMGYGEEIVGFEEHGMGEIEMESQDSNLYKDELYF